MDSLETDGFGCVCKCLCVLTKFSNRAGGRHSKKIMWHRRHPYKENMLNYRTHAFLSNHCYQMNNRSRHMRRSPGQQFGWLGFLRFSINDHKCIILNCMTPVQMNIITHKKKESWNAFINQVEVRCHHLKT